MGKVSSIRSNGPRNEAQTRFDLIDPVLIEHGKRDGDFNRLNVKFIFSSNGHQFVEYDKFAGIISKPKPMSEFPTHDELRKQTNRILPQFAVSLKGGEIWTNEFSLKFSH